MKYKERLMKFLELQNKNINFEEISKELGISTSTLRSFLNKRGYKNVSGKYILEDIENKNNDATQIEFGQISEKKSKSKKVTSTKVKQTSKKVKVNDNLQKEQNEKKVTPKGKKIKNNLEEKKIVSKSKPKKDRKINITQEDLDKLCEVYDWYLEVKDNKSIKSKNIKKSKKDIRIEDNNLNNLKSTSIRVDKNVWEDFERLCSNSQYSKQEIITQAIKDFMKEYKNLL